jgi:hypothetical protein
MNNTRRRKHPLQPVEVDDIRILKAQLNRTPVGVVGIAARCEKGFPIVTVNEALADGKPFPTLYWLTCPLIVKAISKLEGNSWSDRMKENIEEDAELEDRLKRAHIDYRNKRLEASAYSGSHSEHIVFKTGIGGVDNEAGIKCLHAHYAHYLASGENPLGEIVHKLVSDIKCERQCDLK